MAPQSTEELLAAKRIAEDFADQHVKQGAMELLEWQRTGVLVDGVVRQLDVLLAWAPADQRLKLAEDLVQRSALRVVAAP